MRYVFALALCSCCSRMFFSSVPASLQTRVVLFFYFSAYKGESVARCMTLLPTSKVSKNEKKKSNKF